MVAEFDGSDVLRGSDRNGVRVGWPVTASAAGLIHFLINRSDRFEC